MEIVASCVSYLQEQYEGLSLEQASDFVAAFFGYSSLESLESDNKLPIECLEDADVLIPAFGSLKDKLSELKGCDLPTSDELIEELAAHLESEGLFHGDVWYCSDIETYVIEEYLPNNVFLDDELCDLIAETNAYFDDAYYDSAKLDDSGDKITVTVVGTYSGSTHDDKMFCGDRIDFTAILEMERIAGQIGFSAPEITFSGEVYDYGDDYDDAEELDRGEATKPKEKRKPKKKAKDKKVSKFFQQQLEQSRVKAEIVHKYFAQWSKVMISNIKTKGSYFGTNKLVYLDLYSGPGVYDGGEDSTPLLILKEALFSQQELQQYLYCVFNDSDEENIGKLRKAISELDLQGFKYQPQCYIEEVDQSIVDTFARGALPPTLLFADPFGYKGLSLDLVNSILKDFGSECIFFFNYNRVQAAIHNSKVKHHMLWLFGNEERLQRLQALPNGSAKEQKILDELYAALTEKHARYYCAFRFPDQEKSHTSHYLIYVTKHELGFKIMNSVMGNSSTATDPYGCHSFECDPRGRWQIPVVDPTVALANDLASVFTGQSLKLDEIFCKHASGKKFVRANYVEAVWKLHDRNLVTFEGQKPAKRTHCGKNTTVCFV